MNSKLNTILSKLSKKQEYHENPNSKPLSKTLISKPEIFISPPPKLKPSISKFSKISKNEKTTKNNNNYKKTSIDDKEQDIMKNLNQHHDYNIDVSNDNFPYIPSKIESPKITSNIKDSIQIPQINLKAMNDENLKLNSNKNSENGNEIMYPQQEILTEIKTLEHLSTPRGEIQNNASLSPKRRGGVSPNLYKNYEEMKKNLSQHVSPEGSMIDSKKFRVPEILITKERTSGASGIGMITSAIFKPRNSISSAGTTLKNFNARRFSNRSPLGLMEFSLNISKKKESSM